MKMQIFFVCLEKKNPRSGNTSLTLSLRDNRLALGIGCPCQLGVHSLICHSPHLALLYSLLASLT